jgi:diguanylate cyclase (GGDEF)-like protein
VTDRNEGMAEAAGDARWRALWAAPALVRRRAAQVNRPRMAWGGGVLLLLNLVHVAVFRSQPRAADPRVVAWANGIEIAHGVMALLMLALLGVLALAWQWERTGRGTAGARLAAAVELAGTAAVLGFAVTVVAIDQAVTPNVSPFLLASLLMGLLMLLPPVRSLLLYLAAGSGFLLVMSAMQPDATLRLSNQVNGLTACALGWLLSSMLWRRFVEHETLVEALRDSEAELRRQQQRLRELAVRDGLTRLWNRTELRRLAERELALAQRHLQDTSLILLDLDRFKHINDGWGHPAGDAVLQATAGVLRRLVRGSDEVGRLGGEEFVILLPQTDLAAAAALAERLRSEVAALVCPPVTLPVSASFGVACMNGCLRLPAPEAFERLYAAADRALYGAKQAGRNRVGCAPELLPP